MLGGTAAAYLISGMGMRDSIMTQKISRRGVPLTMGPEVDFLHWQTVRQWAVAPVVTIPADSTIAAARASLTVSAHKHQAFPVVDDAGLLVGMITRQELFADRVDPTRDVRGLLTRPAIVVFDDATLRDAADLMVQHGIGRLPVVTPTEPRRAIAIITRSDLLQAHAPRLDDLHRRNESSVGAFTRTWSRRKNAPTSVRLRHEAAPLRGLARAVAAAREVLPGSENGRDGEIRTPDLLTPSQAR